MGYFLRIKSLTNLQCLIANSARPSGKKGIKLYRRIPHISLHQQKSCIEREMDFGCARSKFRTQKSTRICDRHFDECDFKMERTDENVFRNKSHGDLLRRELRDDAVPHIWPGYPDYFSKISPKQRSTTYHDIRIPNETR